MPGRLGVHSQPSRGQFEFLEQELGSSGIEFMLPPVTDWLSADEAAAHAGLEPVPKRRGGRRGSAAPSK